MFKSIRWTLQLWHALLLLVVVCVFSATLYYRLRLARMQSVDAELEGMAQVLAARIHPGPPPRRGRGDGPEQRRPDGPGPRRADGPDPARPEGPGPEPEPRPWPRFFGGPPDSPPPWGRDGGRRGPPEEMDRPFWEAMERNLEVPENALHRFEGDEADGPYYVIWRSNGDILKAARAPTGVVSPGAREPTSSPFPPRLREHENFREVIVPGPFATQVLVGRSVQKERAELRQLMGLLAASGVGVTLVGLVGGWLLSKRAIGPILAITATAQTISASNLSRRISLTQTESELGSLANVLNAMFARLEAAFERQVRFTADASHELRTPLSIIYSHSELALGKQRTAEEYRDAIETCFRASKRMKSLVESLLMLARADAGRLEIKHESFDLAQTAEDCVSLVGPLAAEKKVELKLDLQPATISGDPFRITQVITNLLTNAINYNREGGNVCIRVKLEAGQAELNIADTGVGIAPEDQRHLFERFYRVDKARSRELGGTGLGLAICKSIIEAHGGAISFTSTVGVGTSFMVYLPQEQGC